MVTIRLSPAYLPVFTVPWLWWITAIWEQEGRGRDREIESQIDGRTGIDRIRIGNAGSSSGFWQLTWHTDNNRASFFFLLFVEALPYSPILTPLVLYLEISRWCPQPPEMNYSSHLASTCHQCLSRGHLWLDLAFLLTLGSIGGKLLSRTLHLITKIYAHMFNCHHIQSESMSERGLDPKLFIKTQNCLG